MSFPVLASLNDGCLCLFCTVYLFRFVPFGLMLWVPRITVMLPLWWIRNPPHVCFPSICTDAMYSMEFFLAFLPLMISAPNVPKQTKMHV